MLSYFRDEKNSSVNSDYHTTDFVFRLKKLEKICTKESLDAILIVTGIDGRENTSYVELFNWLFLGTKFLLRDFN